MRWPEVTLDSIAEISGGSTPRRNIADYWEGNILWVTPSDLPMPGQAIGEVDDTESKITEAGLKSCSTKLLDVGSVLFSSRATIGKVGIALQKLATNQGFTNFTPRPCVTGKWLAYVLMYRRDDIAKLAGSTTFKEVSKSAIRQYKIPLPPLSEQRKIVELLDQADALRKRRAAADQKAERILPALFYKMFGDPATNPRGWEVKTLEAVSSNKPQYGANAKAREWRNGDPRYIRITDINADGTLGHDCKAADLDDPSPYLLSPGDLLFARSGNTVGKAYLHHDDMPRSTYAGYLIRFRLDPHQAAPWFLFALTRTPFYESWVDSKKRVAGQPNINGTEYASLSFPCPDIDLQNDVAEIMERLRQIISKKTSSQRKITSIFTTMLHRAFSGELTAKWREAHMQELLREMEIQARELGLEEVAS